MGQKSFTLIELLVVIAIIGLLASVVLVSMAGIREKAKITRIIEFSQSLQRNLGAYAVGIWSFDDGSGITAKDSSGYNNNGAINGGAVYTADTPHAVIGMGTGKYALSFDGVDDYVDAGTAVGQNLSAYTLEAWVKPDTMTGNKWITGKVNVFGFEYRGATGQKVSHVTYNSAGVYQGTILTTANIAPGNWYHIVATHDGTRAYIYVNGVLENSKAVSGTYTSTYIFNVGSYNGVSDFFNGLIDEVRIYEKALTLGEVQKHYADGLGRHQNLAAK